MNKDKIFSQLQKFASTDRLRSTLNGIYCERGEKNTLLTATDGNRLLNISLTSSFFDTIFKDEFGIEPINEDFILYQDKKTRKELSVGLMETNDTYPRWKNVVPSRGSMIPRNEVNFGIHFNSAIMSKIQKDINILLNTPKSILVMDYFTTAIGASIKYIPEQSEFIQGGLILLMPIRSDIKSIPLVEEPLNYYL